MCSDTTDLVENDVSLLSGPKTGWFLAGSPCAGERGSTPSAQLSVPPAQGAVSRFDPGCTSTRTWSTAARPTNVAGASRRACHFESRNLSRKPLRAVGDVRFAIPFRIHDSDFAVP